MSIQSGKPFAIIERINDECCYKGVSEEEKGFYLRELLWGGRGH
jgi:hypothetical protein